MKKINKIGNLEPENPFFLAPLAGVTDSSFRRICKEEGASLVYSEMVSGKGLYFNGENSKRLLKIYDEEKPVAFQIFGCEPDIIAFTAEKLRSCENVILDINMGCPVPKVVKNGEGSALLKNPELVHRLVKTAVENAGKPVTAKIRIGWDHQTINAVEVAQAIEAAGGSAVAVHGRTREQYYSGKADWSVIKEVKQRIGIPVIGNGDIFSGEDAMSMLEETGCDFVMIARGAMGNPWIFKEAISLWKGEVKPESPTIDIKMHIVNKHFNMLIEEKGENIAVREMRKHIGWYLKGIPGATEIRRKINQAKTSREVRELFLTL